MFFMVLPYLPLLVNIVFATLTSTFLRALQATVYKIIRCLHHSFSRFGFPRMLINDNGTQFVSHEFEGFLHCLNIYHAKGSNFFLSSNSCIECFYSTLKSRLQ